MVQPSMTIGSTTFTGVVWVAIVLGVVVSDEPVLVLHRSYGGDTFE